MRFDKMTITQLLSMTKEELAKHVIRPMNRKQRLLKRADWIKEAEMKALQYKMKKGTSIKIPNNIKIEVLEMINNNAEYNKARNFVQGELFKAAQNIDEVRFMEIVNIMQSNKDHAGKIDIKGVHHELTAAVREAANIAALKMQFAEAMITGNTKEAEKIREILLKAEGKKEA